MTPEESEKVAVEKMKLAAIQGIPGEPILAEGEKASAEDRAIMLPPHQRILTTRGVVEEIERPTEKIPAAQLAKIVFKLSTGEEGEPCELSVGEARLLLAQMASLNQMIERRSGALLVAENCLNAIRNGGVAQGQVVDALAAIKHAK